MREGGHTLSNSARSQVYALRPSQQDRIGKVHTIHAHGKDNCIYTIADLVMAH